jgi:hypothetical protein
MCRIYASIHPSFKWYTKTGDQAAGHLVAQICEALGSARRFGTLTSAHGDTGSGNNKANIYSNGYSLVGQLPL